MILKRIEHSDKCTRGVLIYNGDVIAVTLENPWLNNTPFFSCIPLGIYSCKRVHSPKFGKTFEVTDVGGRTHILFHSGNVEKNTSGCILLGKVLGSLKGEPAVLSSGVTVKKFMDMLEGIDEFELSITNL